MLEVGSHLPERSCQKSGPNSGKAFCSQNAVGSHNSNCPAWKVCFILKERRYLSHTYKHKCVKSPPIPSNKISRNQWEPCNYEINHTNKNTTIKAQKTRMPLDCSAQKWARTCVLYMNRVNGSKIKYLCKIQSLLT